LTTSDYCDYIGISVSNSSPKYTYIPEGITIDISYNNDSVYGGAEGYSEINIPFLYELDRVVLSGGGNVPSCVDPFEQTCYVMPTIPPVPTDITLRVKVGQDISVRVPFYYDNYYGGNGVENEDLPSCEENPIGYSNIEAQTTKLSVTVEGPSYPYDVTVIHAEKPHEREYALYCAESIPDNTPLSLNVQVVSGDYDYFRIYGWNSLTCVKSLEDIPVKKGTTKAVTLRFDC